MTAEKEQPEPKVEAAKAETLQRAAMIAMLGRQVISRNNIPLEWKEIYDALHRESTPRSGEDVYFEGERLRERRNEHPRQYRMPYWNGVIDALEASFSLGANGVMYREITTADKSFLIEKLARAQSGMILLGAGLIRKDIRITQDEFEGRIAAFEWALGYRETTERTPAVEVHSNAERAATAREQRRIGLG